jgi:deoxycytidylate deaminase
MGPAAQLFIDEVDAARPVIALTGAFGGGLSTAAERMKDDHGYRYLRLSDELRREWAARYGEQEPARSDLQRLGDELRQEEGPHALVKRALARIENDMDGPIVIESIKNVGEIHYLRRRFGYRLLTVAILSNLSTRTRRTLAKYQALGLDENHLIDDDLRDRNEELAYGQQVELCIDLADIIVANDDGTSDDALLRKVDDLVGLLDGRRKRALTDPEIYMHSAYSLARSSKCIKRHVGAVLVDALGQLIAGGFNENPKGTKPCVEEKLYNYRCYRDIVRTEHFAMLIRRGAQCPVCRTPIASSAGPPWRCERCLAERRKTDLEAFYVPDRAMSWCTAVHAEVRAILAAGDRARGATLYTTTFPCMQCAEKIIQAGVVAVYYTEAYPDRHGAERLGIAGIPVTQFEGVRSSAVERIFPNPWLP